MYKLDEGNSLYTRKNILDKNVFINNVQAFSSSFSDSGLFGLKLAGSASHVLSIFNKGEQNCGRRSPSIRETENCL